MTPGGAIVVVSRDGERWELPAGRPEDGEPWVDTLRRDVREEACATVLRARLLGFTHGVCVSGRHEGLVLDDLHVAALPFAPINARMIREAAIG